MVHTLASPCPTDISVDFIVIVEVVVVPPQYKWSANIKDAVVCVALFDDREPKKNHIWYRSMLLKHYVPLTLQGTDENKSYLMFRTSKTHLE